MLLSVEPKPISNTQHYLNSLISRQIGQEFKETEVLSFQTLDFYELINMIGHTKKITQQLFDMDREMMITASEDGLIKLWNLIDGHLIATLRGHSKGVEDIDISFDHKYLASCGADGRCIIWDLENKKIEKSFFVSHKKTTMVTFFPKTYGFIVMEKDNLGHVFTPTLEFLASIDCFWETKKTFDYGCFNTSGDMFTSTCGDIILFSFKDPVPERVNALYKSKDSMTFVNKVRDKDLFICGSSQKLVICDFTENVKILYLKQQKNMTSNCYVLEFNGGEIKERIETSKITNDLKYIIIGFSEGTIRVYKNDDKFSFFSECKGKHTNKIKCIELHPKRTNIFATCAEDGQTIIWDLINGLHPILFFTRDDYHDKDLRSLLLTDLRFSPDGSYLSVADDLGTFSLFGIGSEGKSSFRWTPPQQFFQSDYNKLLYDGAGNCIDEKFKVAPHLVPRGSVCDFTFIPYSSIQQILNTNNKLLLQCTENRFTPETYSFRDNPEEAIIPRVSITIEPNEQNTMLEDTPGEADDAVFDVDEDIDITQQHLTRNAASRMGIVIPDNGTEEVPTVPIVDDGSLEVNESSSLESSSLDEEEEELFEELESSQAEEKEKKPTKRGQRQSINSVVIEETYTELLKEIYTSYPHWINKVVGEYDMTCPKKRKVYFPNVGDHVYYVPRFHEEYLKDISTNITGTDNLHYIGTEGWISCQITFMKIYYDDIQNEVFVSVDLKVEKEDVIINNIVFTQSRNQFIFLKEFIDYNVQYIEEQSHKRVNYGGSSYRVDFDNSIFMKYKGIKLVSSNGNIDVSINEIDSDYMEHRSDDFADEVREILINKLREIVDNEDYQIFKTPVDIRMYPNYIPACPFPIDFNLILQRLINDNYYRTYDQVEWEIFKLIRNAVTYNGPNSPIGECAIEIAEELKPTLETCRTVVNTDLLVDLNTQLESFKEITIPNSSTKQRKTRKGNTETRQQEVKEVKEPSQESEEIQVMPKRNLRHNFIATDYELSLKEDNEEEEIEPKPRPKRRKTKNTSKQMNEEESQIYEEEQEFEQRLEEQLQEEEDSEEEDSPDTFIRPRRRRAKKITMPTRKRKQTKIEEKEDDFEEYFDTDDGDDYPVKRKYTTQEEQEDDESLKDENTELLEPSRFRRKTRKMNSSS
ncbi:Bromodomain containing protein [Entamoeba nuttalli P19]|uniref:Bromodomain containing protein n=1 Tax=Entamoeba nuttalli (strain P19) TaxID=1076696 RepID=K2HUY6_ENTNP|nr:Bromodomain containing protein [Entamoeba nuttalli P19]EKE40015.1 Bromodomain containing protein [Entamoeba nuttalli P19]|eukprot:XP_008857651.1 Bromodomain containing protein [Entamoeba nuttalli P19]